jgi:hypothetical protein
MYTAKSSKKKKKRGCADNLPLTISKTYERGLLKFCGGSWKRPFVEEVVLKECK